MCASFLHTPSGQKGHKGPTAATFVRGEDSFERRDSSGKENEEIEFREEERLGLPLNSELPNPLPPECYFQKSATCPCIAARCLLDCAALH